MVLAIILLFIIMYKSNCNIIENTAKVIVAWADCVYVAYRDIADYIKDNNIEKVGILTTEDTYEYPLWGMLRGYDCQIEHVKVDNLSGKYEDLIFQPDCIFVYLREDDDTVYYHGAEYTRIDVGDYYTYLMEKVE